MRDRQKSEKARTRRLIQEGAILEKALPQTTQMDFGTVGGIFYAKYSNQYDDFYERPAIDRFFFFPKGALTHHPKGGGIASDYIACNRALLRGGCAPAGPYGQLHITAVLLSLSTQLYCKHTAFASVSRGTNCTPPCSNCQ